MQLTRILPVAAVAFALSAEVSAGDRTFEFHGAKQTYTYEEPGQPVGGAPIVFVHGWASSRTFWHKQIDVFSEDRVVLAVDLPGNGASEDVPDEHSMDLYADAIAAAMDDAGIEKAILIGHSNGVPTIRHFVRNYPDRVSALVAVDGAFENLTTEEQANQFLAAFESDEYLGVANQVFGGMQAMIHDDADRELVRETMLATPQRVMVGGLRAGLESPLSLDDRVPAPLLIINAESPWWTEAYMERVQAIGEDVEAHVWEGVSHFLFMDEPEKFNEAVQEWLAARER